MRKLKLIFFWLWPRKRERGSKKVIIWCQEDPNEAITKTLPPGFSLPAVTPCLLQLASGQGLFSPCTRPHLASEALNREPLGWDAVPGAGLLSCLMLSLHLSCKLTSSGLSTLLRLSPVHRGHWAHCMYHLSLHQWSSYQGVFTPFGRWVSGGREQLNELLKVTRGSGPWLPGSGTHTLHPAAPGRAEPLKSMNCRDTRPHISTPWQVLPIIRMLYWSSQMFRWGTPKGQRHILNV